MADIEIKWIKITTGIFDDEKMKLIDTMPDNDALIVIWFKLLALAGKINDDGQVYVTKKIAITDEMLAAIFNRPVNTIRLALRCFKDFEMIEMEKHINIINWDKHQNIEGMEKIRLQNVERQRIHRDKKKQIAIIEENKQISNVTSRDSHGTEEEEDKEEEKEKEYKHIDVDIFFSECWEIYPNKKGKGQIYATKKKEILKLGDEFKRCIGRYVKSVDGQRASGFKDLNYQNGSTFFNSGYVDYLDKNYKEPVKVQQGGPLGVELSPPIKNGRRDNW